MRTQTYKLGLPVFILADGDRKKYKKSFEKDRILILDKKEVAEMYKTMLESKGFEVYSAINSESALNLAYEKNIDLILLDLNLIGTKTNEFLNNLKTNLKTQNIPVIGLGDTHDNLHINQICEMGAAGFIHKLGSSPKELLRIIRKVLK